MRKEKDPLGILENSNNNDPLGILKKKEETQQRDYSNLSEQLGKRFENAGSTMQTTKSEEDLIAKKKRIQPELYRLAEESPEKFSSDEGRKGVLTALRKQGYTSSEADIESKRVQEIAINKPIKDNSNRAKSYLKYVSGYGKDASITKVANASDREIEEWTSEMLDKGISQQGIDNAIYDFGNQYRDIKGKEKGEEYDKNLAITAWDRARQSSETGTPTEKEIKIEKDEILKSNLRRYLPEDLKIQAGIEDKVSVILEELKSKKEAGTLTSEERDGYEAKLIGLEKLRNSSDLPDRLFNPVTGEMVDRKDANSETLDYEDRVIREGEKLTDKEKTLQNAKKALHRFEAMDDLYNSEVSFTMRDGRVITAPYREIDSRYADMFDDDSESGRRIAEAKGIKNNWLKAKAQFEAINRAYSTNTDPAQVDKGFFSYFSSVAEKSAEAFDSGELTTDTDIKFANEYVSLMDDLGSYVTPEQRETAKISFGEKLADATVTSAAIARDIAISALVTRNAGTLLGVGSKLGKIKNLMTNKWGKFGKHVYNISEEMVRGGVTFAPTDATFAEGAGEGFAQGSITALLGKRGKALGRLAEFGIRVTGGTATEVVQEYSGQLINELTTAGVDVDEAFKRTFGRNIEDATDKLLLTATVSAMFSGAFNANVLFKTRETLQSELDKGNVPEEKIDDVESVLKETAPKETKSIDPEQVKVPKESPIESEPKTSAVKEEIKPIEDVPTKEEVKEEKEVAPIENVKPIETGTEQEARGDVELDTKEKESVKKVKPKIKGETLIVEQTRKGVTKKIPHGNVDKKAVLFKDKNGNTLHKSDRGFITIDKKGNPKSEATTKTLIKKYEKTFDYSKGEKAKPFKASTEEEADRYVAENSNNPKELAELIQIISEKEADVKSQGDTTKDGAIAEYVGKGSVNRENFFTETVGDKKVGKRKNIHESIPANYLTPKGDTLDIIAQNASELAGVEVTVKDVADFIMNNPKGAQNFKNNYGNDAIKQKAQDRFRDITGLEPSQDVINTAIGKIQEEVATKESILKDIKNLTDGNSTSEIAAKAIKAGIIKDPEIQEALKPKIKSYKNQQDSFRQEFGLDESSEPLPFQKGSRKNIVGRKYLGDVIKKLEKALPGIKVEFDESMKDFGTIKEGVIFLNPKKATSDTAIHEYAHIWTKLLKAKNNILYKTGIDLVKKNEELMDYIASTRPDLTNENDIAEEALVTTIGEDGSDFFQSKQQQNKLKNLLDRIARAIRNFFGIKKSINWREISEMSLKDFTKLASKELLNETPLTTLTKEDVQKIMSEDLILDSITIDSDILTGKGLNKVGEVKEFFKGILTSAGKLPRWVANLDSNTRAAINAIMSKSANDVKLFNNLLKEHIKENKLNTKEINTLLHDINDVFTGEKTVNAIGLDQNQDLALAIASMRNNIDLMSKELAESGYIEGDLVTTINDNIGMYIRRSYEIHKAKPKSFEKWINKLPPEVIAKAKNFIVKEFELSKIKDIKFINNGDGTYKVTMINEFGMETPSVTMSRGDLISVLSEDEKLITDGNVKELNEGEGLIRLNKTVNPEKYGIKFKIKEQDVNKQISDILEKHLSKENSFGAAGLNKKDVSILKKRKDIPKEIRDLLGEIKDPVANYMETVTKMASYLEYSKFLHRLKNEGEGTLIWDKSNRPDKTVRISAENNPRWKPLDGMYTTKEFMDALEHFEREGYLDWKSDSAKYMYGMVMYLNTLTKTSLTKWNIPSNFRNHYGAIMMAARAGYFNPIDFAKAYSDFWKGMKPTDVKNFDRKEFEMLKSYGMIDDGVGFQTYKESLNRAMKAAPKIKKAADNFSQTTTGKIINAPRDFMDKAYLAPDAAAKIFLFRKMKTDYAKAYPNLTEEQLNEKVANIVKDIMPTYSKMSKGAKTLSRNPLIGAFASFTTETVRNYSNQAQLAKQEFKDYKETGNPELLKLAKKKVNGMAIMTLAIPTLATALRLALGIDNDDEEAIRSIKAPWEKNAWTLYLDKGKDGTISSVDLSYTDPLSVLTKPLYALMNGIYSDDLNTVETAADVTKEIADQFMGREPMFGALWEASFNKDSFGKTIAKPMQDEEWKRVAHVLDMIKPKFIDTFKDVKKVWSEDNESEFGRKYEPLTYSIYTMGVRVKKNDILKAVKFKIGNETQMIYDAKNIYNHSDDKSQKKLDKANTKLAKVFKEHSLNIKAAEALGASKNDIIKALNQRRKNGTRYIPKYWADQLLNKQFIPITKEFKKTKIIKPKKRNKPKYEDMGQSNL